MKTESLAKQLSPFISQTPLILSQRLSDRYNANVYLKMENRQVGGSIKARGGFAKILSQQDQKYYTTASSGNHGISFSMAAQALGCSVDVFVPIKTSPLKVQKIKDFGANLIITGRSWDEANESCLRHSEVSGATYVNSFEDDSISEGYSTAALEIVTTLPQIDVFLCSIGGGSIITGMGRFLKAFNPQAKIYGVETFGAHSMNLSMEAGHPVTLSEITSTATSLGIKKPSEKMFHGVKKFVDGLAVVSDRDAHEVQKYFWDETYEMIELAASCNISALENGLIPDVSGKNLVLLICGGNDFEENLSKNYERVFINKPYLQIS